MANASEASYGTRCRKLYARVSAHAAVGVKVPRDEVLDLRAESRKLDEIRAYLDTRTDPSESLAKWRARKSQLTLVER